MEIRNVNNTGGYQTPRELLGCIMGPGQHPPHEQWWKEPLVKLLEAL